MADKVLVVGAGAAGMLAAAKAAERGLSVTLLERNDRPGRKIVITGKGRCNVTNAQNSVDGLIANVPANGKFLYAAFSNFMPRDTVELFESLGVPLKTERGNRVFPVSDNSMDIVDALHKLDVRSGVKQLKGRAVRFNFCDGKIASLTTEDGTEIFADAFIVATGGKSYPVTGSTGDGYSLAEQAGHTIVSLRPSLVPLEAHEGFCTELQGLSLRNVELHVFDTKKKREIFTEFGEMLFTHFGVSGPLVLSAGAHMREMERGRYELHIDLKPALSFEQLDARLLRDFSDNSNKDYINSLGALLPRKLIPVIAKLSGIKPATKVNQITKEQRKTLAELLKCLKVTVTGFRPIEEAIVTSGGVKTSEIDPSTMRSKICENLYFAGEVIDVDAYTGGFNLQIAFSTGCLAGSKVLL